MAIPSVLCAEDRLPFALTYTHPTKSTSVSVPSPADRHLAQSPPPHRHRHGLRPAANGPF